MTPENECLADRRLASALRGSQISADKRRGQPRNNHVSMTEREYTPTEMEFLGAIERYKNRTGHKFPTWTEVLSVVKELGYVKPL